MRVTPCAPLSGGFVAGAHGVTRPTSSDGLWASVNPLFAFTSRLLVLASVLSFEAVAAERVEPPPPVPGASRVFLLDAKQLQAARQRIRDGDKSLHPALEQLKHDAKEALKAGPSSVMQKKTAPPSGDQHDYMSQAPYFWPNPGTSNGLPFIRRDGERNPDAYKNSDRPGIGALADNVETLALAYYLTSDETYAARATLLIRTWFLDPATRMNPNFQYAQAVPGVNTGRGIGLIESRSFTRVVDAVGLLAGSKAWPDPGQRGLQEWFAQFLQWMIESEHGRDEAAAKNNHGTYYDLQIASFALFVGKMDLAIATLKAVGLKRIAVQIEPDGRQPLELERTRAWSYSIGNLAGLMLLAGLGEKVGVDLWNYQTDDGRSIRKALDFLAPFGVGGKKWPYQQIDGWSAELFYPVLRRAAVKYPDAHYRELLSRIPPLDPADRNNLLRPQAAEPKRDAK